MGGASGGRSLEQAEPKTTQGPEWAGPEVGEAEADGVPVGLEA